MKITWLGHSAFRIETGGSVILIDPFLSGNEKFQGSVEEASRGCTHIALTHGHDDHVGDTVDIAKNTGATVIATFELAMYLNGQGVEKVDPGNPGGRVDHDDFGLTFVNALHSSSTIIDGRPVYLGAACGLVIEAGDKSVYHMGDTEIFSDMALINELHAPQIGIVPIGDRFTMGARTAATACRKFFDFTPVIPCHYGTFPIIDQTPDKFIAEMQGQNVKIPEIGEAFEV